VAPAEAGLPPDDLSIPGAAVLWRRVPPHHFVPDAGGTIRPSSAAFENDPDGDPMSTVLATPGRDPFPVLLGNDSWALVAIPVTLVRELGWVLSRQPTQDEPDHVVVFGNKTLGRRRRVARACTWVIAPPSMRSPEL
jgi:hypothetical protein